MAAPNGPIDYQLLQWCNRNKMSSFSRKFNIRTNHFTKKEVTFWTLKKSEEIGDINTK